MISAITAIHPPPNSGQGYHLCKHPDGQHEQQAKIKEVFRNDIEMVDACLSYWAL